MIATTHTTGRIEGFPECDGFPPGRRYDICTGQVNLPLYKVDFLRSTMGFGPIRRDKVKLATNLEPPPEMTAPLRSIGLSGRGVTAVRRDGKIVWERMIGFGDFTAAILRRLWLDKPIKRFIAWWWNVPLCKCHIRQEHWNRLFPFPLWLQRGIRLFIGPR